MVSRMIKHFIRTSHIMLRLVTSRYLSGGRELDLFIGWEGVRVYIMLNPNPWVTSGSMLKNNAGYRLASICTAVANLLRDLF